MLPRRSAALRPLSPELGCDERAYVLLEKARLRCEALIARNVADSGIGALSMTHQELGYAGYVASTAIEPDRRHTLLGSAHQRRGTLTSELPDAARRLVLTAAAAEDAVSDALGAPHLANNMHLAHVHLLHAQEILHHHLPQALATPGKRLGRQPHERVRRQPG